ncbi:MULTISPECIES: LacI family DNA-binding transcriptional regulator [unclassified Croceitalea]|uniref:LacI family DNA-binding transcriptional regulator n=1 Tax=unclassified Croceitalea TaxID=2632280 RepID=UPI0030D791A0
MNKRITLRELANNLDLSISTVSKSLSGSSEISEDTKRKVIQLATDLNYSPNYHASRLKTGSSMAIGVILPSILNPYYAKLLSGIEKVLAESNYKMITLFSEDSRRKEEDCLYRVLDGSVEGIIICMARETQLSGKIQHLQQYGAKRIPKVFVDRLYDLIKADQVVSNDMESAHEASNRLLEKYKLKNLIFTSLMGDIEIERLRFQGYALSMVRHGLENKINALMISNLSEFQRHLTRLLKEQAVDGIFCANESTLKLVLEIMRNQDTNGWGTIPVTAFSGSAVKKLSNYPLLHIIDQCAEKIGRQAAGLLLRRVEFGYDKRFKIKEVKTKII